MTDKVKVGFGMDTPLSKNREVPAVASVTWVLSVWSTSYEKSKIQIRPRKIKPSNWPVLYWTCAT